MSRPWLAANYQANLYPGRRRRRAVVVTLLIALAASLVVADPAFAAVSVSRAEVSGSGLRLEGTATANRDITVDGVILGRSDSGGKFRIERNPYTPPADCTIDVNDGSATPRVATLSGCTVSQPPPTSTFAIDDRPLPDGNVGTDYNNFVTATGGNGTPYRWSIAAGALPAGLAIRDFASASGLIFGRPTTVQVATFTVRATDQAGNSTTRQFTITINAARPLVLNSPSQLPSGTVGAAYEVGVFADGGTTPYSWTQIGGTLPPGLALQASPGRILGTPTTAGTFSFTLRVADSAGQSTSGTFSITVTEPAPPPTPPGAPTLLSPANGASVITPFTISWSAVSDPSGISAYNWALSTTSDFATTAAVGTAPGTATHATVNTLATGTYFWHVQAVNGQSVAGAFSATRSLTVTGTTNAPALVGFSVTPTDLTGGTSASGSVTLTLAAPAGGTTVGLTSGTPTVAAVPASVTVAAGATSATFTVTTQPVTSSFTVVITATLGTDSRFAFLSVNPPSPLPAPTLVSPASGARFAPGQTVSFDWSDVAGAATYTLQASTSSSFTSILLERSSTTSQVSASFTAAGDRFWRVRANRPDGSPGAWSAVRAFRIK